VQESMTGSNISMAVSTKHPEVSVVIPSYNRGAMLIEAVESVLAQSFTDIEIIVIDDGSTDPTEALIQPYLDRITFRRQQNAGVAAARNHGIRLARGAFICFLDSDDQWRPNKLAVQLAVARSRPEYGLIASEIQAFDDRGLVEGRGKASMYKIRNGRVLDDLLFSNWIQTSTVMVRRECLEKVGGFDEDVGQFGEDWLLWMRIAAEYPIYFVPEALVLYRMHEVSLTSHRPELQYQSLMTILNKMSAWPQFAGRTYLIRRAKYRIAIVRGRTNLRAGDYQRATEKLRQACRLKRVPLRAAMFLLSAAIGQRLRPQNPDGAVL
jgi:glycosyltransferase involved in cell wall biosynthesis